MSKHLDELWDHPISGFGTAGADALASPSRTVRRAEQERETAVQRRASEVGRQQFGVIQAHANPIRALCVGPTYTYSAGMDGLIKVWNFDDLLDVQGGKAGAQVAVQEIKAHSSGVSCLCVVDENLLCSGGWDSTAKVWDMSNGHTLAGTLKGHVEFVRAVAGNAGRLYTGSNDRTIRAWDLKSMQCVGMMAGHSLAVISLAVANDKLFSGGYDLVVKVWDIHTGLCLMDIGGHQQVITNLSVACQIKVNKETGELCQDLTVYSSGEDNVVFIWDAQTLTCKGQLHLDIPETSTKSSPAAPACVTASAPPPTQAQPSVGESRPFATCHGIDRVLYVGDRGGAVQLWDLETMECVGLMTGHAASIRALASLHKPPYAYSLLLSASEDGSIRMWKNSRLVAGEKEGIQLDNERRAQVRVRVKAVVGRV